MLEERALAGKLNSRRLRGVMTLWKRRITATGPPDPVLGPWRAFAAVPAANFSAAAVAVHRDLTAHEDPKAPAIHPLVAKAVLASPPATMGELVARYTALFAQLEARWREHAARSPGGAGPVLPETEWESLRQAIFGPNGALAIATDGMRFLLDQGQRGRLARFDGAIQAVNATHPAAPARAMVLSDAPSRSSRTSSSVAILAGLAAVPRRFLRLLAGSDRTAFRKGSGRLELALAIADARNPLTARVMANRVWRWHFGKGLVGTPSDFGLRSDPPSHPELLDYLASELMASGWSLKSLHRRIMLSSTYHRRSDPRPEALERDPENRLLWRFNRQRLDFEAMRDSILAVSGRLVPGLGAVPRRSPSRCFRLAALSTA